MDDVNRNDPEECEACQRRDGLCGYHEGYEQGVRHLAESLTTWIDGDFEGDPYRVLISRRMAEVAQRIFEGGEA